jgi:predicted 2-oxoglutarate/Fe(II)-dependent dioxygenase YbiX
MTPNRVLEQLGIYLHPGFVSADECEKLRSAIDSNESRPAALYRPGSESGMVDEQQRKTTEVSGAGRHLEWLAHRFESIRPRLSKHFDQPLERVERPHFLIYKVGDFFLRHRDTPPPVECATMAPSQIRKVTALLYLSSEAGASGAGDYEGGRLTLYGLLDFPGSEKHGFHVQGEAGLLVAFPSDLFHGVTELTRGQRYCALTWYY